MAGDGDLFEDAPINETERVLLVDRWFALTREILPALSKERDWPVRLDHCFMRILLDNAFGGAWRKFVEPPAYRNAPIAILKRAVDLGQAVRSGEADIWELNRRSLKWRGKL